MAPFRQEFVAKLLWYSWDAGTRSAFAQPGGVGLKVLQVPVPVPPGSFAKREVFEVRTMTTEIFLSKPEVLGMKSRIKSLVTLSHV